MGYLGKSICNGGRLRIPDNLGHLKKRATRWKLKMEGKKPNQNVSVLFLSLSQLLPSHPENSPKWLLSFGRKVIANPQNRTNNQSGRFQGSTGEACAVIHPIRVLTKTIIIWVELQPYR